MTDTSDSNERNWTLRMPRLTVPEVFKQIPAKKLFLGAVVAVVAMVAFCFGLLHTSLFAVQRIDINGLSHLQRDAVLKQSGLRTGGPMIAVNEDKAAASIEANAWIESAHVRSKWPHVITVDIKERTPIAQAQTTNKQWATIGTNGVVLGTAAGADATLPALLDVVSPPGAGASLDATTADLINVAQLMPDSLRPHVKQLQNQSGQLKLGLDTGTVVELGDNTDLANKLVAAASVISHTDAKKLKVLDVRSPHLPIATPTGPPVNLGTTTTTTAAGKSKTTTTVAGAKKSTSTTVKATH